MRVAVLACCLSVWSVFGVVPRASALELTWLAPPECASTAALRARIAALLLRYGRSELGLSAEARVDRVGPRLYRLTVHAVVGERDVVRVVQTVDCPAAGETAAWLLAMAATPTEAVLASQPASRAESQGATSAGAPAAEAPTTTAAVSGTSGGRTVGVPSFASTAPGPAARTTEQVAPALPVSGRAEAPARGQAELAGPASPPSAAPVRPSVPVAAAREGELASPASSGRSLRARQPRWARVAGLAGLWGSALPAPAAVLGARLGGALGSLYADLTMAGTWPRQRALPGDAALRVKTFQVRGASCAQWGDVVRWGPCLFLEANRSAATVDGTSQPGRAKVLWLSAGASVLVGLRVYRALEITLETGAALPLTGRPRFFVAGRGQVARASFVAGHALIGIGARWQ